MAALAQETPRGPKTRYRNFVVGRAPRVRASTCRSARRHSGKSGEVRRGHAGPTVFENWNRYYEPYTGRYLQPEPLWLAPGYVANVAKEGIALPAYSYAYSNPVLNIDRDGRKVEPNKDCDKSVREMLGRLEKSLATSKSCRCTRLLAKYGIVQKVTSEVQKYSLACHSGKISGQGSACGYGKDHKIDLSTRSDCTCVGWQCEPELCPAKSIIHELLHTDDNARFHSPEDGPQKRDGPGWAPFNEVEACVACDGTVVQN